MPTQKCEHSNAQAVVCVESSGLGVAAKLSISPQLFDQRQSRKHEGLDLPDRSWRRATYNVITASNNQDRLKAPLRFRLLRNRSTRKTRKSKPIHLVSHLSIWLDDCRVVVIEQSKEFDPFVGCRALTQCAGFDTPTAEALICSDKT
jgi:hypothetical protein